MSALNLRVAALFAGAACTLGVSYKNPVLDASTPDPGVLYDPRTRLYWAAVTSGNAAARFPLYTSTDLLSWKAAGHVFPDGKSPSWAKQDFWAPEPHLVNNGTGYAVYYAARNAAGILSVGVATSRYMNGSFVDIGHPLFDSFSDGQIGECIILGAASCDAESGHALRTQSEPRDAAFLDPAVSHLALRDRRALSCS
jgi:beta-xylosidase